MPRQSPLMPVSVYKTCAIKVNMRQQLLQRIIWARSCKNVSSLDSKTPLVVIFEISRLKLDSAAEQAGLNVTWLKFPEDAFSRDVAHMNLNHFITSVQFLRFSQTVQAQIRRRRTTAHRSGSTLFVYRNFY